MKKKIKNKIIFVKINNNVNNKKKLRKRNWYHLQYFVAIKCWASKGLCKLQ